MTKYCIYCGHKKGSHIKYQVQGEIYSNCKECQKEGKECLNAIADDEFTLIKKSKLKEVSNGKER